MELDKIEIEYERCGRTCKVRTWYDNGSKLRRPLSDYGFDYGDQPLDSLVVCVARQYGVEIPIKDVQTIIATTVAVGQWFRFTRPD